APVVPTANARARWNLLAVVVVLIAGLLAWLALKPSPPPSSAAQRTVAVLPFVAGDASEASADNYIAFGMTEALITELSRVGALKVISQTSVMQFKGARKPLKEI